MSRGAVNVLVFFVDTACLAAAPASDDVILMCESAKVSGTVTSHASGLPFDDGIKVAPSWRLPPFVMSSVGSLCAGICASLTARQIMSFSMV